MKSKALNGSNDLLVVNGNFVYVDGAEYVTQNVRQRLQFIAGEWFLDKNAGVPYFEQVFVKPANLNTIQTIFKDEILNTPEVNRLVSFYLDFDAETRELTVSFEAETIYGSIDTNNLYINL